MHWTPVYRRLLKAVRLSSPTWSVKDWNPSTPRKSSTNTVLSGNRFSSPTRRGLNTLLGHYRTDISKMGRHSIYLILLFHNFLTFELLFLLNLLIILNLLTELFSTQMKWSFSTRNWESEGRVNCLLHRVWGGSPSSSCLLPQLPLRLCGLSLPTS